MKKIVVLGKILTGISLGFSVFYFTSHPNSKLKNRIPVKRYKNLSLLPNIKYVKENNIYHLHHWLFLSICYISLLKSQKIRKLHLIHGLFLGGIIQGLLYKDRFKFFYTNKVQFS